MGLIGPQSFGSLDAAAVRGVAGGGGGDAVGGAPVGRDHGPGIAVGAGTGCAGDGVRGVMRHGGNEAPLVGGVGCGSAMHEVYRTFPAH